MRLQSWEKMVFSDRPETHKPTEKILPDFTPETFKYIIGGKIS